MSRELEDWIESVEKELEGGDEERALLLTGEALKHFPDDPDLLALQGDVQWALDDVRGASRSYERAAEKAPDSADLLSALSRIRFSLCDFFGARRHAREALRLEACAGALDVLSRLADRSGQIAKADRLAAQASAIYGEAFPRPFRIAEADFRRAVEEAVEELPESFRQAVRQKNVAILVEPVPTEEVLIGEDPPFDPAILGLYRGTPLIDRVDGSQAVPDTIHLYHHNLERVAANRGDLVREIAATVYHELGHFFGLTEEELADLDLD